MTKYKVPNCLKNKTQNLESDKFYSIWFASTRLCFTNIFSPETIINQQQMARKYSKIHQSINTSVKIKTTMLYII